MRRISHSLRTLTAVAVLLSATCVSPLPVSANTVSQFSDRPAVSSAVSSAVTKSAVATPSANPTRSVEPTRTPFVRIEQSDPRLLFVGAWKLTNDDDDATGGALRSVSAKGALVAMTFKGTAVRWVGANGPSLGKAEVYLDGIRAATVDQSARTSRQGRVVWSSATLAAGTHRLEIRVLGERGASGTGTGTILDALDVRGVATMPSIPAGFIRVQERDARLTLFGSWQEVSDSAASSGSYKRSLSNGSGLLLSFRGTALSLVGPVGPTLGKGDVFLDGRYVGATNQQSARFVSHQLMWSAVGLANSYHLVEIRPQSATSKAVSRLAVDAAYVGGSLSFAPLRIEESDVRIGTAGPWKAATSSGMSGNAYRYVSQGGGVLALRFSGSSVRILGLRSPTSGEAEVVLDGVSRGIVNLYSPTTRVQQVVWRASGLGSGEHELRVKALGTAATPSRGERVGIDGFDVQGKVLAASRPTAFSPVEEDDARLALSGSWRMESGVSMSSRAYAYSADGAAVLEARFRGIGITWVGPRSPAYGSAQVLVDGTPRGTVSQFSTAKLYRQELWSVSGLAPGVHTLQIRNASPADSKGSAKPIAVDALQVLEGVLIEAPRPPGSVRMAGSDGRAAVIGSWSASATSGDTTTTELRTRDARSRYDLAFDGTAVTWVGSRGPDFGIAEVILDGRSRGVVDLYDYALNPKRVLWSANGLVGGRHLLSIRLSGKRNKASSSFTLGVDSLDVCGTLLESAARFEQDDWRLVYTGAWASRVVTVTSDLVKASAQGSSTLTVRFSGTRLRVVGSTSPASGIASVSVDGGAFSEVDLYSAESVGDRVVFDTGRLARGEHTVRIVVTGRKNVLSSGLQVMVDGFDVSDGALVPQTATQRARARAVDTAIAQLGKRYVWAGTGPTVFDCSGLVLFSYRSAGLTLPHYSGSQWGLSVPKRVSELQPGDLCFDDGPGSIHHVGMYIGDGITINAPGSGRYVEYRPASTYGCFGRLKTSLWPR